MSPFCGATDSPVLDFWGCLPWVSKPGWTPCLCASPPGHNGCLRFNFLAASMVVEYIPHMHVAEVGCWDLIRRPPTQ